MDSQMKRAGIQRWLWIPAMTPVMWGLLLLAHWADRLFRHNYSDTFPPPTTADDTRAAVVFVVAVLTPVAIGIVTAAVAFRKNYLARWPVGELCIVAIPLVSLLSGCYHAELVIFAGYFFAGGVVVMALLNLGACVRQRMWGKFVVSTLVLLEGVLYLLCLYGSILYVDA